MTLLAKGGFAREMTGRRGASTPPSALTTTRRNRAMAAQPNIPLETLRQLLAYEPETGKLTWLPRPSAMFPSLKSSRTWNTRFAGQDALNCEAAGYLTGRLFGRSMKAHRAGFALHHGYWPAADVDHINGNRSDNRIANLRAVDRRTNLRNTKRRRDNSTGVTGVYWVARWQKWTAKIAKIELGYFRTFEEAVAARKAAEICLGFHANHGREA